MNDCFHLSGVGEWRTRNMDRTSIVRTSWWKSYRRAVDGGKTHSLEVFVRSLGPRLRTHGHRSDLFRALDAAAACEEMDGYETTVVGKRLCLCEECLESSLGQKLVAQFVLVQNLRGDEIEPLGFEKKRVESAITDEQFRVLVPPSCFLTVTVDGTLFGAFPCRIEGESYRVSDFVEALPSERSDSSRRVGPEHR